MPSIRPLERTDLPAVTSLYEFVALSGSREAAPGLLEHFERMFLDHPWADPELPSLVYLDDDGAVAGFIGSSVRRLLYDGAQIRMGVSGQLVTDPRVRNRAAGAFLMKEYLAGPQDLTVTDTASATVRRIWERLGGDTYHLACIGWIRAFRPLRFVADFAARRERRSGAWAARTLARPLDPLVRKALRRSFEAPPASVPTEELTPEALVEHMPSIGRGFALYPAYDVEFARWLLREVRAVEERGELVGRLVRDARREPLGWFVYYSRERAIGSVLQVAAREDTADRVLDALFADAQARGAAGLQGRLEGILREPLARRGCRFHQSGFLALVHARDPALLRAIHAGHALLTRLEGEGWMGPTSPSAAPQP